MTYQTTLRRAVSLRGIGLHTGQEVELTLCPAPADTGYVFRRTDLNGFEVAAVPHHVTHVSYATTLMRAGVMVSTVEHVLSALYGCGIDNAILDVTNCEVPILDGSARPFVEPLLKLESSRWKVPGRFYRSSNASKWSKETAGWPSSRMTVSSSKAQLTSTIRASGVSRLPAK